MADQAGCSLVITTGGTGPAPRDVTPEATVAVCQKLLPGFGEQMRAPRSTTTHSHPLAQTAGIRGRTLILNLPAAQASARISKLYFRPFPTASI